MSRFTFEGSFRSLTVCAGEAAQHELQGDEKLIASAAGLQT